MLCLAAISTPHINDQEFLQAGRCCLSGPELKPNKEIQLQDNN
jgi:hypothetical protein